MSVEPENRDWRQPDVRARYCGFRDAAEMFNATGIRLIAIEEPEIESDAESTIVTATLIGSQSTHYYD